MTDVRTNSTTAPFTGVRAMAATVDWITATGVAGGPAMRLETYGRHLVGREAVLGDRRLPWAFYGYVGYQSGRARWGTRPDGCLLIAASELASETWEHIVRLASHCSRIDLAVTVWLDPPQGGLAREAFNTVDRRPGERGRPTRRSLIVDGNGGETAYLGARESDWFARVYDKRAQSGAVEFAGAWRYECEVKGRASDGLARRLLASADREASILATVHRHFTRHGLRLPFSSVGDDLRDTTHFDRPPDAARLRWLSEQVRPAVADLTARLGLAEVLGALGIAPELLYTVTAPKPGDKRR